MRTCLASLLALAAFLTAPGAYSHVGDEIYPFFELLDEDLDLIDLTDGSVDDWLEVVGEPSLTGRRLFLGIRLRPGGRGLPHLARLAPGHQYPLDRHGSLR